MLPKPLFFIALCFCFPAQQFAQTRVATDSSFRRNPAIGLHYSVSNFSHSPFETGAINHGYALSFLDGITGKYDYMVQAGSISPRYPLGKAQNDNKDLLHFINIYGMRRFFADTVFINPFIGAGPGMLLYNKNIHASITAAAGFQLRISTSIFLHTQLNYQINLASSVNNNLAASIGLLGTILHRKQKSKAIWTNHAVPVQQKPLDTDGDGVADNEDACPTAPGPRTFHGCPDTDGDGIPDNKDSCVTEPGTSEFGGCPQPTVKTPALTIKVDTLTNKKPVIHDSISSVMNELGKQIYFETDKATLTPESIQALTSIINILKMQPFTQLQIEGHTDNTGTEKRNADLSLERANTVLEYLVNGGIDRKKLTATGFGATRPVADNSTPEGRAKNRRTLFVLYK